MFTRNIARVVARQSSAGLVRRAVATPICKGLPVLTQMPSIMRCGGTRAASSTSVELAEVIQQELTSESELSQMDEELKSMVDALKSKGITIKDEPGSAVVQLFGPGVGSEKVMIEFSCQEEGDGDDGWEDDNHPAESMTEEQISNLTEQQAEELMDEESGSEAGFRFIATVTKGAKKLVFTGTATDKISLAGITTLPASADNTDSTLYQGPVYEELEPKVQDALMEYLRKRNIGDQMAAFISMYADHKEQSEYLNWLKEVQGFVIED